MASKRSRRKGTPRSISVAGETIRPVEHGFAEKLRQDRAFVLALIDDPVKAFKAYGYNGDDKMMSMLRGMSENLHLRAVKVFGEILNIRQAGQACDACNGCRACKACSSIPGAGEVMGG